MRISDWSSDVCSSDLKFPGRNGLTAAKCRGHTCHLISCLRSQLRQNIGAALECLGKQLAVPGHVDADVFGLLFAQRRRRSEEHTSELQSLMRISYAVFCLKTKQN